MVKMVQITPRSIVPLINVMAIKEKRGKVSVEQRVELARRYHAGEKAVVLAKEFGISANYIWLIAGKRKKLPKIVKYATCHPESPVHALNLCQTCYRRDVRAQASAKRSERAKKAHQDAKREMIARFVPPPPKVDKIHDALANAKPDGSKCVERACPFLAINQGRCRNHLIDLHSEYSATPSTHAMLAPAGFI